jgi:LysM repeat protein
MVQWEYSMGYKLLTRKTRCTGLAVLAISALFALISPVSSFAQSSGIGGKPAHPDASNARTKTIFVKTIKPGETATDEVAVTNNGSSEKTVLVYATDSVPSSGGAFACAQAIETPKNVGKWLSVPQASVAIPAGATVNVPFSVTVPKGADPGEQNGCIVLQEKKDASVQGGISLSFRTAIRVAVLVPGDIRKEITPVSVDVSTKDSSVIVSPTVKNTGNVSVDVEVTGQLTTIFGVIAKQHGDAFPLLRDQLTTWNLELKKPFWGGFVVASYQLKYDASDNYIGVTNNNTRIVTVNGPSKLYFVPPSLLALCIELFIAILVIGLAIRYVMVRAHRRIVAEDWKDYKVKAGDQLQTLATKYGIAWRVFARANHLKAPYNLTTGQLIKVPHRQSTKKKPTQGEDAAA